MTSVTEYIITVELIEFEKVAQEFLKELNEGVYVEVFMGNSRKRCPKIKFGHPSSTIPNFGIGKTVCIRSPLIQSLEFWVRKEGSQQKWLVIHHP